MFNARLRFLALFSVFSSLVVQPSDLAAQDGQTFKSVAEIPAARRNKTFVTYEAGTGNVYLSVGEGIHVVGLQGLPFELQNIRAELKNEFQKPDQADEIGIGFVSFNKNGFAKTGIFNLGPILPANGKVTTAADFTAAWPDGLLRSRVCGAKERKLRFNVILAP